MSKATKVELTYAQFAHDLGAHQRLTLAVSLVWHKEYVKADAATRSARREEFMSNFVVGYLECTPVQAVRILTATIGQRTKEQHKAYMAASQKFKYHIARDGAKAQTTPTKSMRLSAATRQAAKDFLAMFDNLADAKKALEAVAPKK